MARSQADRTDRLEDSVVAHSLLLQSHGNTLDLVLKPLVERVRLTEEHVETISLELAAVRGGYKTAIAIITAIATILTLALAYAAWRWPR